MLNQIIAHTPIFVWAILAFLLYRGFAATRTRETGFGKQAIIPLVMLALSLQDVFTRFGGQASMLAAWAAGLALMAALIGKFGSERIGAGSAPGSVRVRGSWVPLMLMLAVFCTKYAAIVVMAVKPQLRQDALFAFGVCALFGVFSGCFLGRLLRDLASYRALQAPACAEAA